MDHIEFNGAIENLWHVFGSLNESMSKLSWERQFFYYRTSLYFEVTIIHILVNMFLGILKYFQRDFFPNSPTSWSLEGSFPIFIFNPGLNPKYKQPNWVADRGQYQNKKPSGCCWFRIFNFILLLIKSDYLSGNRARTGFLITTSRDSPILIFHKRLQGLKTYLVIPSIIIRVIICVVHRFISGCERCIFFVIEVILFWFQTQTNM